MGAQMGFEVLRLRQEAVNAAVCQSHKDRPITASAQANGRFAGWRVKDSNLGRHLPVSDAVRPCSAVHGWLRPIRAPVPGPCGGVPGVVMPLLLADDHG
jgi:hypothetical protein